MKIIKETINAYGETIETKEIDIIEYTKDVIDVKKYNLNYTFYPSGLTIVSFYYQYDYKFVEVENENT